MQVVQLIRLKISKERIHKKKPAGLSSFMVHNKEMLEEITEQEAMQMWREGGNK